MPPSNERQAESGAAGPEKTYFTALAEGRFSIQRCLQCERAVFYPRSVCPHCGGVRLAWFEPSGRGTVYATTVVHRKAEQGGNYNVCLVDLDEGVRVMSRVDGLPPSDVRIGMRVRASVEAAVDAPRLVFSREEAAR